MSRIKLTSKRQATFPKSLCDDMNLRPGDTLVVAKATIDGEVVWCLRPAREQSRSWFGALRKYGKGKRHDMTSIRRSMEKARKGNAG